MSKKVTKMSKMKKINKNGYFLSFTRSCIDRIAILLKQTNWVYKNKGIDIISSKIWDGEEEEEALGMEKKKKKNQKVCYRGGRFGTWLS